MENNIEQIRQASSEEERLMYLADQYLQNTLKYYLDSNPEKVLTSKKESGGVDPQDQKEAIRLWFQQFTQTIIKDSNVIPKMQLERIIEIYAQFKRTSEIGKKNIGDKTSDDTQSTR